MCSYFAHNMTESDVSFDLFFMWIHIILLSEVVALEKYLKESDKISTQ